MKINCFWEHNGDDTMLYAVDHAGAFARGKSLAEAKQKLPLELRSYLLWRDDTRADDITAEVAEEKESELNIRDADTDAIFLGETLPMSADEYKYLKALALKSAADFLALFNWVPVKTKSCLPKRKTFYGDIPRTANEMYEHTKNVNSYYFGEINIDCDNDGDILSCRKRGFELAEKHPDLLNNKPIDGSYGEVWSLKKVLRRFIWHDRIHAKALYRMALKTFPDCIIPDPFCFSVK